LLGFRNSRKAIALFLSLSPMQIGGFFVRRVSCGKLPTRKPTVRILLQKTRLCRYMLRAYEHTKAIGLLLSKSPTTYSQIDTARFVDKSHPHKPPMELFRDILLDVSIAIPRTISSGG
jgi:hypothetical protein